MRMKDMLWSKEEEEEGTVKATCDLLSNSYLYLRKTITSSTSKELRDNVNFYEWFLGIWGWRLLSSHITNKTFWKLSLILFVYKFYSLQQMIPIVFSFFSSAQTFSRRLLLSNFPFFCPHSQASLFFWFSVLPSKKWLSHEPSLDNFFLLGGVYIC